MVLRVKKAMRVSAAEPAMLFAGWLVHDLEEALTFPHTVDALRDRLGIDARSMSPRQSWTAVGLMGVFVGAACIRGGITSGKSGLYRRTVAGLELHVASHLVSSLALRGYSAGVVTALPVMYPAARCARQKLEADGVRLCARDYREGVALLLPAAVLCHGVADACERRRRPRTR